MTERAAAAFADYVECLGVLFLWLVIVIRAVPALRQRNQRTIWTAVLLGACAMSLRIAPIYDAATLGSDPLGANREMVADLIGLFAAAGIFAFVLSVVGRHTYSRIAYVVALLVAVILLLIDHVHNARTATGLSHSPAGNLYWLILLCYHLVANVWCAHLCWRCSARTRSPTLKAALLIFCGATGMAALLMFVSLIHFFSRIDGVTHLFPIVEGIEAVLYGLGIAVPLARPIVRAYRESAVLSALYPLWRDLTGNVAGIALSEPRSYPTYLLRSRLDHSHGLYRRVIEIQDGILALYRYVLPAERLAAARFVRTRGVDRRDLDAAATACCIAAGLRNKAAGRAALADCEGPSQRDTNLSAEAAHLSRIAGCYCSPLAGEFAALLEPGAQPLQPGSVDSPIMPV